MNCPRCGTSNHDDISQCIRCGALLLPASQAETFVGVSLPPMPGAAGAGAAPAPAPAARHDASNLPTAGPWAALGVAGDGDQVDFGPRYRIDCLLGQGGMGSVYKAWDKELNRPVALKLIRPGLALDPGIEARFKQELLLASKISHKNILRIHDLGEAAGVKFISMAYIEGHDLYQVLTREGKLGVERALPIAKQLCSALQAAHAEGVVHRDFKPQNILLDKQENVYVSDFGLAKSLEQETGMTKSGEFLGTPRYMAPEQAQGGKIDHRADLYALGLILYEMVTGDVPFHAETTLQLMYKRVHEAPKSPKTLNPDLPEWLERVIMKCLERDTDQRYQTAGDILRDLETGTAPAASHSMVITLPSLGIVLNRRWLKVAGAVAVLAAVLLAVPAVRHRIFGTGTPGAQTAAPAKQVAVLPLKVLGDAKALGYISDGVTEALSAKLVPIQDVHVAPAAAVERLKKEESIPEVAAALGVAYVVQGTLQGGPDKIRIVLNLYNASGRSLWTQEFSGVPADLLTLEDQMYSRLVSALALKATNEEIARAASHPTENIDAYQLYLKGRNAMHGKVDPATVRQAIALYDDALKNDSSFALAYTGITDASLRMYLASKDSSWADKALGAAQQAQGLADNLPEVHFALGSVYAATGKSSEAIAELKRALELAPNSDEGYRRLGDAYRIASNKEEALRAYRKAVDVNPYYWYNHNALGAMYLRSGDYEHALSAFQRATELAPNNATPLVNLGTVYLRQARWEECIAVYRKALEIEPIYAAYTNIGTAYFYEKRYSEAAQMFEKAVQLNPNQELAVGNLADSYRWAGDAEKAKATYNKAIALAQKEVAVNPKNSTRLGSLALYLAKGGDPKTALQYIRRARMLEPSDVELVYIEAVVKAIAGNSAEACQALRTAFEKGYAVREAQNDPELSVLNSNPEFQKIMKEYSAKAKSSTAAMR